MDIKLWFIAALPKKMHCMYIQRAWDKKTDKEIIDSFNDAVDWIELNYGILYDVGGIPESLMIDCNRRLRLYVLPQIERRGLVVDSMEAQQCTTTNSI